MEFPKTKTIRRAPRAALFLAASSLISLHAGVLTLGTNWVINGDAEAGAASTDGSNVPIPFWNGLGSFPLITAVQYEATTGNFPAVTDPGPPNRGSNFFAGGNVPYAAAIQSLDLTGVAAQIDGGQVNFILSGFLGGWSSQTDYANFSVSFYDASALFLDETKLIGPDATARGNQTGLLAENMNGTIPAGARTAVFEIESFRNQGTSDDGYADNLSFVANNVSVGAAAPEPSTAALAFCALLMAFFASRRYRRNPM